MTFLTEATQEQRQEWARKGQETRKANIEKNAAARQSALVYVGELSEKIKQLETKLAALEKFDELTTISAKLTGKYLLSREEIAKLSIPWTKTSGVYFLIDGKQIIYVGQSVNVYERVPQHTDKKFDRFAFVPCAVNALNMLESLYIYCLRPPRNGVNNGKICAPISLEEILSYSEQVGRVKRVTMESLHRSRIKRADF